MSWVRPAPRVKQWDGDSLPKPRKEFVAFMGSRFFEPSIGHGLIEPSRYPSMLQVAQPKAERHESTPWRRAVASLDCVLCGLAGQTQCAHRNEGKGMGLKTDDALTAALCIGCHTEIDQGKDYTREERRRRMDLAILLTIRELARRGLIGVLKQKGLL